MHETFPQPARRTALAALLMAVTAPAWPEQPAARPPLRLVAPFPPGGSVDAVARIVGQALGQQLGQQVIVDNKPGADGVIAALDVIRSAPDGQTLLIATTTPILGVPTMKLKPPYDPRTALQPIGLIGESAFFLFVHPGVPAANLKEFSAYVRSNPDKLNYAAPNSIGTLAGAQIVKLAGLRMTQVPYKGEASAVPDLVTGRVQMMVASTTSLLAQAREGKLKVLAAVGARRSPLAPEVPTFDEAGLPGVRVQPWIGVFAPAGLPQDAVERLSRAMTAVLQRPDVAAQLARQGMSVATMAADEMKRFVASQIELWSRLVTEAGIERD